VKIHADEKSEAVIETLKEVAMNDVDTVGGYAVPVDPMDDLMCESCQ
jgi:hypothetical protein